MDKLTAIKIKYDDGTYSDEIPVSVLSENVEWDSTHTLVDVLGSIDVDVTGTIQDQISQLFNEKVSMTQLNNYVADELNTDVVNWLNTNVNPVGSAVIVDASLSIKGAAADAEKVGEIKNQISTFNNVVDVINNHSNVLASQNNIIYDTTEIESETTFNYDHSVSNAFYYDTRLRHNAPIKVLKLQLPTSESITFSLVVIDKNNLIPNLITPTYTIDNDIINFTEDVILKPNELLLINLSKVYYTTDSEYNYYEYRLNEKQLITSPIKIAIKVFYNNGIIEDKISSELKNIQNNESQFFSDLDSTLLKKLEDTEERSFAPSFVSTSVRTNPFNAYTNGFVAPINCSITKIKLNEKFLGTSFNLFVEKDLKLLKSISLQKSNDNYCYLEEPLEIPEGSRVLLQSDGQINFLNAKINNYIEYGIPNQQFFVSPVVCMFEVFYTVPIYGLTNDGLNTYINSISKSNIAQEQTFLIDQIKDSDLIVSSIDESSTAEYTTNINFSLLNKTATQPNIAYTNNISFNYDVFITKIFLSPNNISTTFSFFIVDKNKNIIFTSGTITPEIEDQSFVLDNPIYLPKNSKLCMQGNQIQYYIESESNGVEVVTGSKVNDSPVVLGFNFSYKLGKNQFNTFEAIKYALVHESFITTEDFELPYTIDDKNNDYFLSGRWWKADNDKYCTNNDGAGILFKVKNATNVTINLATLSNTNYTPYFAYSIDGSTFTRQLITNPTINIPDTLEHFIWIVIDGMGENDPVAMGKWAGTIGIYINSITSDGDLYAAIPKNKSILYIGDSISEGINALGAGANADTNSATACFTFKLARKLNCIPLIAGYGATCAIDTNGSFKCGKYALEYYNQNILVDEKIEPDIIFLEHGVNDASVINNTSTSWTIDDFEEAYEDLILRCHRKYPGRIILCMIPFRQTIVAPIIRKVAAKYNFCYVLETADFNLTYADGGHPDDAGHTKAANLLYQEVLDVFGKEFFFI